MLMADSNPMLHDTRDACVFSSTRIHNLISIMPLMFKVQGHVAPCGQNYSNTFAPRIKK